VPLKAEREITREWITLYTAPEPVEGKLKKSPRRRRKEASEPANVRAEIEDLDEDVDIAKYKISTAHSVNPKTTPDDEAKKSDRLRRAQLLSGHFR
jgi:hypothetical protein